MAYRILEGESVEEAIRRIAQEQIGKAADEIADPDLGLHETIHQFRKRCKKIRGLVRLVRPAFDDYSDENAWFRDRAGELSDLRDATSMQECLMALIERYENDLGEDPFPEIRGWLAERRSALTDDHAAGELLATFRTDLADAAQRAGDWKLEEGGIDAVTAGIHKTYRRARNGMRKAAVSGEVEDFHEWRKRVKYYRYHTRLVAPPWPRVLRALHKETKRLSDLLGDDHDLAVLREALIEASETIGPAHAHSDLLALIDRRSGELRAWSLSLGRRLFHQKPKRHARWIREMMSAWRSEQRQSPPLSEASAKVYS